MNCPDQDARMNVAGVVMLAWDMVVCPEGCRLEFVFVLLCMVSFHLPKLTIMVHCHPSGDHTYYAVSLDSDRLPCMILNTGYPNFNF